ncbi:O-antigen ligase family protein [Cupriavidus yeoncheonensis]|nr:O-antigen ligase family protein [Cupriavidus yeoncheonensis]
MYTIRSSAAVEACFRTIFFAAIVVALIGIVEWRAESNPFTVGLNESSEGLAQLALDKSRDGAYRAQSTFFHPLAFGQFLAMAAAMLMGLRINRFGILGRGIWLCAYAIFAIAIVATNTRSSIIGMFLVVLCFLFFSGAKFARRMATKPQRMIIYAIIIFIAIIGAALSFGFVSELVAGRSAVEKSSSSVRIDMLIAGIPVVLQNPLFGVGIQNGAKAVGFTGAGGAATLDNLPLYLAVETGFPSMIAFYGALFMVVMRVARGQRRAQIQLKFQLIGLAITLVVFILTSTVSALMQNIGVVYAVAALALITISLCESGGVPHWEGK